MSASQKGMNDATKTSNMNIYSLQCLSKWIKNIESDEPKLTDLDLIQIKDDILKNVFENGEAMKLLYVKDYQCYQYNDYDAYENQMKLNKEVWSGYHSIIHYILSNESLLIPLLKPDIIRKESKINKLLKLNESSLSIITKQSVSILHLLLFDTKIISPKEIYRNDYTFSYSIYGIIKEQLIKIYDKEHYYKQYNMKYIMELYLDLFIKCMECTDDDDPLFLPQKHQKAIINVQYEINNRNANNPYNQRKFNGWKYLGLFDDNNHCCIQIEHIPRIKIPINLLKQLLWRNIYPFQLILVDNWKKTKCMNINDMIKEKTLLIKFKNVCRKIINSKFERNNDVEIFKWDKTITFKEKLAVTAPLVIMPFLNEIKIKMRNILNECLLDMIFTSTVYIDIIMEYLYCDLNVLYDKIDDFSDAFNLKCFQFINYICLFDVDVLFSNNTSNQFLGAQISKISQYILKKYEKDIISMCGRSRESAANSNLLQCLYHDWYIEDDEFEDKRIEYMENDEFEDKRIEYKYDHHANKKKYKEKARHQNTKKYKTKAYWKRNADKQRNIKSHKKTNNNALIHIMKNLNSFKIDTIN